MLNFERLEHLLEETTTLLDELSNIEEAANQMKRISESISQTCKRINPGVDGVARELERLSRLHEVIQSYVYAHAAHGGDGVDESMIGFEKPPEEKTRAGSKNAKSAKAQFSETPISMTNPYELSS